MQDFEKASVNKIKQQNNWNESGESALMEKLWLAACQLENFTVIALLQVRLLESATCLWKYQNPPVDEQEKVSCAPFYYFLKLILWPMTPGLIRGGSMHLRSDGYRY